MTLLRSLRHLCTDTRAASLVETALITPMFCALVCGAADASLGFANRLRDQQAAARAVEFAVSGGLTIATADRIRNEAMSASGLGSGNVAVDLWLECAGVRQSSVTGTCPSSAPARYVAVTVTDQYAPVLGRFLSNVTIPLRGYASARVQ